MRSLTRNWLICSADCKSSSWPRKSAERSTSTGWGLELQRGMAKTKPGAYGAKAALATGEGDVMAFRIGFDQRRGRVGAGCLRIHGLSFLGKWMRKGSVLLQGPPPVTIERVRKLLIPGELRSA